MTVEKRGRSSKPAANRIGVLVLGMHRSGTSALTRVLNLLGCDLPKTLMDNNEGNELGHWESSLIAHLNDEILSSAGSNWHDWLSINPGWGSSPKAAEFKEKALDVLEGQFGASRLFVLKDPRICRLAPFWLDVLREKGVQPAVVIPVRNPLEVAESLASRDGIDPALGQLLWLRNVLEAEAGSRGLSRYHTSYDALLAGWPKLAVGMQEQLGISWPRLSPLASEEIDDFLTKRLRHHQETPSSVSDNPLLSAWLRETFDIFTRWANGGEDDADYGTLDRIRKELDTSAPAFARLIAAGERSATQVKQLQANLKEATVKVTRAEAAVTAQHGHVESLELQLAETKAALTAAQTNSEQKQQQIGEMTARLSEAQSELDRLQAEVQSLRAAVEEARGELSQTQSELAQRSAEADDVTAQLRRATDSLAEEQSARQRETEQAGRLANELEQERSRVAAGHEEIAELTRMLRLKEDEWRRADTELKEEQSARQRETEQAGRLANELEQERSRVAAGHEEIAELTRMLRLKEDEWRRADTELKDLRAAKAANERRLAERFNEIATMTRLLVDREREVKAIDQQVVWLREISGILLNGSGSRSLKGRLAALMPESIRLSKQKERLKRLGMFDSDAYLAANPDVAQAGLDPLWHYLKHGMAEGRKLALDNEDSGAQGRS